MTNKYQKAIESLKWSAEVCRFVEMKDIKTLEELVEKAIPKKAPGEVHIISEGGKNVLKMTAICPACGNIIEIKFPSERPYCVRYCDYCGQRLGEDDE